jgi:hypothetical protein
MARFGLVGVFVGVLLGLLMTALMFLETYNPRQWLRFGGYSNFEEGKAAAVSDDGVFLLGAGRADITG